MTTFAITGNGTGLTLNVTFGSNTIASAAIGNNAGSGYSVGDLVGINTSFAGIAKGTGAVISVDSITATDTLYLTDVQGKRFLDNADLFHFNTSTNKFVALTGSKKVDGTIEDSISSLYSGNVIEVNQYNHGMHSTLHVAGAPFYVANSLFYVVT